MKSFPRAAENIRIIEEVGPLFGDEDFIYDVQFTDIVIDKMV